VVLFFNIVRLIVEVTERTWSDRAIETPSGLFFQDREVAKAHLPLAWTKADAGDEAKLMQVLEQITSQSTNQQT
jgi:hypothetical protein